MRCCTATVGGRVCQVRRPPSPTASTARQCRRRAGLPAYAALSLLAVAVLAAGVPAAAGERLSGRDLLEPFDPTDPSFFDSEAASVTGGRDAAGQPFVFKPARRIGAALPRAQSDNPYGFDTGSASGGAAPPELQPPSLDAGMNFRLDLQQILAWQRQMEAELQALVMEDGGSLARAPAKPTPFNTWVSGRYGDADGFGGSADEEGRLWQMTTGASYHLSADTQVGVFARQRGGEIELPDQGYGVDGKFLGGGGFAVVGLPWGVNLLTSGMIEHGDHGLSMQYGGASFDSRKQTLEARLTKRFDKDGTWLEPEAKLRYSHEQSDGFSDDAGGTAPASDLGIGQFAFGPAVGTTLRGDGQTVASIAPHFRFQGIWDLENETALASPLASRLSPAPMGYSISNGVDVTLADGLLFSLGGDLLVNGEKDEGWTLTGGVGSPMTALGLGDISQDGTVKVDMSTNQEGLEGRTRITIPLE